LRLQAILKDVAEDSHKRCLVQRLSVTAPPSEQGIARPGQRRWRRQRVTV